MSFTHTKTAAEQLATPVQYLKGVGPDRALLLEKLEIRTARDLLFYFPRSYQDMSELKTVPQLVEDEPASVCGVVEEVELKNTGTGRTMLGVLLRQDRHMMRAVWFNQPQLRRKFQVGQRVMLAGVPRNRGLRWEMAHPKIEFLSEGETPPAGQVLPVYSLTEGLTQAQLRKIILQAIETHAPLVDEVLAPDLLDDLKLWPIHAALPQVHAPTNRESLAMARRRFIYQELLVLQLGLALRRQKLISGRRAAKLPLTAQIDQRIRRLLPFTPTPDQESAIRDVARDMNSEVPMNRLLQGDVGTGKTVVAQFAVLLAIAHGYQAAIMAPTEVLARQHARTLGKSLSESRVRIGLLTGSLTAVQRRDLLEKIAAGQIDLIIGTHAVVHAVARSQTQFAKLGLVIIDEQH
ncbi:MAG TPA: DEAD/DEAH box helicase, partial [Pirellulaceae bacterium]|nr:DEAD/DEAH box helicase [Pirellulaceae bacterium]